MNHTLQLQLREFVNKEGKDELLNEEKLKSYIVDEKLQIDLRRFILVLSCESTKDYVLHAGKNSNRVELNNLIMSVVRETGLRNVIVKENIATLCKLIGVNFNYEIVTSYDPVQETFQPTINTLDPHIIQSKLDAAQVQMNAKNYDKAAEIYEELVKVGSRSAMYSLGMMYIEQYDGLTKGKPFVFQQMPDQLKKGIKLLEMAAENGHIKARIELGNYHYSYDKGPEGLKKAYAYYSSPGIPSTNIKIKNRLVSIFNQEKTNFLVTILCGVLTVLMWIFLFVCGNSVHHHAVLIGWGGLLTVIPSLLYGLMVYVFCKYKYAYIKSCAFAMLLIWLIYPLILAIN